MPRRPAVKASRAIGAASAPTPIHSTFTTPLSSAYPSAYPSENEWDTDDITSSIPIGALTLDVPLSNKKPPRPKVKPFPFLALPSELRIKIYGYHFAGVGPIVDLEPENYSRIHKKLAILRTCRTIYAEASHFFFSTYTFRLFPTHGRFFKTKKPLIARLKPHQRTYITSLELRLGPGWNKPARSWVVNTALGLQDCVNVRRLVVFVECDPSDGIFKGFRRSDGFYENFSRNLLTNVLQDMPFLNSIEFDAWTSVKKSGDMMRGLLDITVANRLKIRWGPERGWSDMDDEQNEVMTTTTAAIMEGSGTGVLVLA